MKVLFQSYFDFGRMYGGGPSVVYGLADELRQLGVEITFHDYWKHEPKDFDLIHYFSWYQNENWLRQRAGDPPLVVTPISWFDWPLRQRLETQAKYLLRVIRHRTTDRARLGYPFSIPQRFFPNSEGEAHFLSKAYGVPREKMSIVPHGVPASFQNGSAELFHARYPNLRDFVLCVGRFYLVRKNQLTLIRALKSEQVPVVFIGGPEPTSTAYWDTCRREAGRNMHFLGAVGRSDPLLVSAYHACKVVVMPALLESPGLVALEGALTGANVATTQGGSTREHYLDLAWYFDPLNEQSIRKAVLEAHAAPRDARLRQRVLDHYTWPAIAKVQLRAYEEVIAANGNARAKSSPVSSTSQVGSVTSANS